VKQAKLADADIDPGGFSPAFTRTRWCSFVQRAGIIRRDKIDPFFFGFGARWAERRCCPRIGDDNVFARAQATA
jgi:hypothetical protein